MPTLAEFLALVAGRAPLLIEIKDQDGALGPDVGALEARVGGAPRRLRRAGGADVVQPALGRGPRRARARPPARPHHLRLRRRRLVAARLPPRRARARSPTSSAPAPPSSRTTTTTSPTRRSPGSRREGLPILTWTIRSPAEEAAARRVADNITFEGYRSRDRRLTQRSDRRHVMAARETGMDGGGRDRDLGSGRSRRDRAGRMGRLRRRRRRRAPLDPFTTWRFLQRARELGLGRPRQRLDAAASRRARSTAR